MPSLPELSTAGLRAAGDAIETVIDFREYLPPGGMLLKAARVITAQGSRATDQQS